MSVAFSCCPCQYYSHHPSIYHPLPPPLHLSSSPFHPLNPPPLLFFYPIMHTYIIVHPKDANSTHTHTHTYTHTPTPPTHYACILVSHQSVSRTSHIIYQQKGCNIGSKKNLFCSSYSSLFNVLDLELIVLHNIILIYNGLESNSTCSSNDVLLPHMNLSILKVIII